MTDPSLRNHFPFFEQPANRELCYFDSAATTQKPRTVIDAISQFYLTQNVNVHRASYSLAAATTAQFELTRKALKSFINAPDSQQIVFTKGATESINLLAKALENASLPANGRILISATEHHANIVPWQQLAAHKGLSIDVIPVDEQGRWRVDEGLAMLSADTCIMALGWVSNALGSISPIEPFLRKARQLDCISVLDAAQATAHLPIDVQQLDCDFMVFSAHKMYGPTGVGVLYGKAERLAQLPVFLTGGEMITQVTYQAAQFQDSPHKFEAGTPNIEGVVAFKPAIDFIQQHAAQIVAHEAALLDYVQPKLQQIPGLRCFGDLANRIALVAFTVDGVHSQDLGMLLNQQGIAVRVGHHCAMPLMHTLGVEGTVRLSLACYNTFAELDAFVAGLSKAVAQLQETDRPTTAQQALALSPAPAALAQQIKGAKGWDNVYRQIMLAGKTLTRLAAQQKQADNEVLGCESQVWLCCQPHRTENKLWFAADSTGKIVRGLLAIILEPVQGQSAEFISRFDFTAYLQDLGLEKHLSESRGNGLAAVAKQIKAYADQNQRCAGN